MLRCGDGSLYTGITTDLVRRLAEHRGQAPGGARYTRGRLPVELVYWESASGRAQASQRERVLKRLKREEKLALLATHRNGTGLPGSERQHVPIDLSRPPAPETTSVPGSGQTKRISRS